MILALAVAVSLAVASDGDLAALRVEQAHAALTLDEPLRARDLVLEALALDPDSWAACRTYATASEQAGLGDLAAADFAEVRTEHPIVDVVWTWRRVRAGELPVERLEHLADQGAGRAAYAWALLAEGQPERALAVHQRDLDDDMAVRVELRLLSALDRGREARRLARLYARTHPERPDTLVEVYGRDLPRQVERAGRGVARRVARAVDDHPDDPLFLYRAAQLLSAARSDRVEAATSRLEALGFEPPLPRPPWSRSMRKAMSRTMTLTRNPPLVGEVRTERHDIGLGMAARLEADDRRKEAVAVLRALSAEDDTAEVALALTRLLAADEAWQEVRVAANQAIGRASRPVWNDVARLDLARQAVDLAEAFGLRAEAALELGDPITALSDAWIARHLDPHPRWDALWARMLLPAMAVPDARLPPTAPAPQGLEALPRALFSTARLDEDGAAGTVTQGVEAVRAIAEAGSLEVAVIATHLAPHDASLMATRARLHEQEGHTDAAFASWAIAASGEHADTADLARTYRGMGDPEVTAMAVVANRGDALDMLEANRRALHPVDAEEGPLASRSSPRPRVGRVMPAWEARSFAGEALSNASVEGRVYVLSVWASWCGPCQRELPELDAVVKRLAAEGLDVAGVAVAVDERERDAERFWQRHAYDALTGGWKVGLETQLRIGGLPTSYVVAADGTVVHQQLGYSEAFAQRLERILRKHAP